MAAVAAIVKTKPRSPPRPRRRIHQRASFEGILRHTTRRADGTSLTLTTRHAREVEPGVEPKRRLENKNGGRVVTLAPIAARVTLPVFTTEPKANLPRGMRPALSLFRLGFDWRLALCPVGAF